MYSITSNPNVPGLYIKCDPILENQLSNELIKMKNL